MKIDINFKKAYFLPSQTAEGIITIFCDSPVIIKSLKLRFYKIVKIKYKKIDGTIPETIEESEKILEEKFYSICENMDLKLGYNSFPFSFLISKEEKSTGIAKSYFLDSMCILERSFMIQSICETSQERYSAEKHLSIVNFSNEKPVVDMKLRSSGYFCIFKRNFNFRIQTDKQWYSRGDNISISLSSLNKADSPYIASIQANVYQIVVFHCPKLNTSKSKLLTTFNAIPMGKNTFKLNFRVPMSLSPSISDEDFTVQSVLIFNLNLYNGKQIKIRKILSIGEAYFEMPTSEVAFDMENYVYITRHLENETMLKIL